MPFPTDTRSKSTDSDQRDVTTLCKDFGESTSMHGLGRVVGSDTRPRRLVWICLLIGAAGMAINNLIVIFQTFSEYPTSTKLTVDYEPEIVFPAVTICNLNRVRLSRIPQELKNDLDLLVWSAANVRKQNEKIDLFLRENDGNAHFKLGHSLQDMLMECSFDARPCNVTDFKHHFNMKLGNCYSFNMDYSGIKTVRLIGPANGLVVELYIEQHEYLTVTNTAGAKVVVHPPEEMPFPEESGVHLAPGFSTSIGLKRVEIERASAPYGDCVDAQAVRSDVTLNMFAAKHGTTYTDVACQKTCYQNEVFQSCQCCDSGYPCDDFGLLKRYPDVLKNASFIPACNTSSMNDNSRCLLEMRENYLLGFLPCGAICKPACSETTYKVTVSSSKWPSDSFTDNLINKVRNVVGKYNLTVNMSSNSEETRNFMLKNFVRLEVYYEDMNFEKIVMTPSYDWYRLLSDIGGQLGLWMGFSILTALEILELLFAIISDLCRKTCNIKRPKTGPDQNSMSVINRQNAW